MLTVLAAGATSTGRATAAPILKGPYLQRLGRDRVEVRFELGAPAPATVELGADGKPPQTIHDAKDGAFHVVTLAGLEAGTRYRYRVRSGEASSTEGEFVTAPADDAVEPFTFAVYGDNRSDGPAHEAVVAALRKESFDFLVNSGDYVQTGAEAELWQTFFDIEAPLLRDKCVFACVGNHELFGDSAAAAYARYFGPDDRGQLFGTFRWGMARFFLLNAFEDWRGSERTWLERELGSADAEPGVRWRFVVLHQSPWSGGPHGDNKRMDDAGIPALLVAHRVDLVIAGHDHIYERGEAQDLKYLISGGGGAPLYRDLRPEASTRKIEASYHVVMVSVSTDAVSLLARRVDGSIIERCGFSHGGWDCDPARASTKTTVEASPGSPASQVPASTRCGCRTPGRADGVNASPSGCVLTLFAVLLGARRRCGRTR